MSNDNQSREGRSAMKPKAISVQDMKAALPDTSSALSLDGLDDDRYRLS